MGYGTQNLIKVEKKILGLSTYFGVMVFSMSSCKSSTISVELLHCTGDG